MKKTILLFISTLLGTLLSAQIVNIPDAVLKTALLSYNNINTNGDTEIQVAEAMAYTGEILVSYSGIADMTGIEAFVNLTKLDCRGNNLLGIDVSQNVALKDFRARYNDFTTIDLSANTQLTFLSIGFNDLQTINLSNNPLIDTLAVEGNMLDSLDVSMLTGLLRLIANSNNITKLDLTQNTDLVFLNVPFNDIDTLLLGSHPNLSKIYANSNDLIELNVSQCPNLEELIVLINDIEVLDLSQNPLLSQLNAGYNEISSINLSNNPMLTTCYIAENDLSIIDVSNNLLLERVEFSYNDITSVDLSNHPNLDEVYVTNCNDLTSLNIANGNNTNITTHEFNNNPNLTCIEVDDVAYANANFTVKDAFASYSTDCNVCYPVFTVFDTILCTGESISTSQGQIIDTDGIYMDTLVNACGGDSILEIEITVFSVDSTVLVSEDFCPGANVDFYGTAINASGIYYHSLSNQNGCDSVLIKTFNQINASVSIVDNNGTLEATTGLVSYQWYQDGIAIANETSNSYTPTVTGTYYCEAETNSCIVPSNLIMIDLGTGIRDLNSLHLTVYPNPTNSFVNIETDEVIRTIQILDLSGKTIKTFDATSRQLNISELNTGIYILEMSNLEKIAYLKVMKL